ncbi:short spindle 3 [Carabus blaptoides fortunei]
MEQVRSLVREQGREARNLIAFHISVENDNNGFVPGKVSRKPPCAPRLTEPRRNLKSTVITSQGARIRSASTGRDKRSELRARYWALLFGNLQRSVVEIYNTVETHENLSECQEVILVLENYTREFNALAEWFRLKWDYENTPLPQRPTSLAWDICKTNTNMSKNRSGKSSPNMTSGRSSPNVSSPRAQLGATRSPLPGNQSTVVVTEVQPPVTAVETEMLSPSEDQKTYVDFTKRIGVVTNEVGTSTDIVEPFKPLVKKSQVVKVNQQCQTDAEPVVVAPEPLKTEPKPVKTAVSARPAYATAVSRVKPGYSARAAAKPDVSRATTNAVRPLPLQRAVRTAVTSGYNHKLPERTGLARSKTVGYIKPKFERGSNKDVGMRKVNLRKPLEKSVTNGGKLSSLGTATVGSTDLCSSSAETIINTFESVENVPVIASSAENLVTDGWLTVKCRSRFKNTGAKRNSESATCWANRFNQVSATASLPALALLPETGEPGINKAINKVTKDNLNTLKSQAKKSEHKTHLRRSNTTLSKSSVKNEFKTKTNSVLEKNKTNLNIKKHTEREDRAGKKSDRQLLDLEVNVSKKNMNDQQLLELETESDSKAKETAEDIASEEEHRQKTQQLTEEEAMLTKQIAELQSSDIDVDTETDGTETDGELQGEADCEEEEEPEDGLSLEARYEPMLAGMSWGERMNTLAALEALVARHPGRALQLHQKLSSPSRRRSLPEILRRYQAKQARAQQQRQALQQEKAIKLQALLARVEDVKAAKLQLIEEKRRRMEQRLQRAAQNRNKHLRGIVRKAHDEEEKLKEIAFINELEAQNKRHDFLALCREQSGRLQGLHEDRRKRQEEKAAKEAAVEERRKALERERLERLDRLQDERRQRNERIGQQQQQRERERQELAREKARDREERLSALHAQQLASTQELQKRISQKQEESARRHEENMEQIRQKAFELSVLRCHTDDSHTPEITPYPKQKFCTLCNVLIKSEVYLMSHLRGRLHQESLRQSDAGVLAGNDLEQYNLKQIVDAPLGKEDPRDTAAKERGRAHRKRCKKIRQRMASKGAEYEVTYKPHVVDSIHKRSLNRNVHTIGSITNQAVQGWSTAASSQLDRILNELSRLFTKGNNEEDVRAFQAVGGFSVMGKLLTLGQDTACQVSHKSLNTACSVWQLTCRGKAGAENCKYVILSNRLTPVLDLLNIRLQNLLTEENSLPSDGLCTALMRLLTCVLANVSTAEVPAARLQDVVSFAVCLGVVERLSQCCQSVRGPVHDNPAACSFLLSALDLLASLAAHCPAQEATDPTHLVNTLHGTELVGVVSMLYGTLLPSGASPRCQEQQPPPPVQPEPCIKLATATFRLLRRVAELDLKKFQEVLGAEGISLQFRHIAGHVLWCCASPPRAKTSPAGPGGDGTQADGYQELLHEVIYVTGYFAVSNRDNQMLLVSGYAPSVLQQLCTLPFPYFSVGALSSVLYPTLLACCSGNPETMQILKQELSYELLTDFKNSDMGRSDRLVKLL